MASSVHKKHHTARKSATQKQPTPKLTEQLLVWYDKHHRKLPWRADPGKKQDPYAVWLSEIMLQQTTVPTVIPYYLKFMKRWPDMAALASATQADVMSAWAGLGYYSRARNLHACALKVSKEYDGKLPSEEQELLTLPGIGPYTAAAIAAIAFGKRAAPVDGNIERVLSRVMQIEEPLPASKPKLKRIAEKLAPDKRAGDFAQAMMDLGSEICTPKTPACMRCPWNVSCKGRKAGIAPELPRRLAKKGRPIQRGAAFVYFSINGEVLLERRPSKGLLASMHGTPVTAFEPAFPPNPTSLAPLSAKFEVSDVLVTHTFTHFDLELEVYVANLNSAQSQQLKGEWAALSNLEAFALPTLFRKVISTAQMKGQALKRGASRKASRVVPFK